jgi:hypothetical protein
MFSHLCVGWCLQTLSTLGPDSLGPYLLRHRRLRLRRLGKQCDGTTQLEVLAEIGEIV